ncbi:unnamed protein product [Calypogeia fissa]
MFKWEMIVGEWQPYMKWVRREVRVIVSGVFLLFLLKFVYSIALEKSSEPSFGSLSVLSGITFAAGNFGYGQGDQPSVKGTSIAGRDAVKRFRDHLDCFSESGRWVYDPTPRHIPWNYVGDAYTTVCEDRHRSSGVSDSMAEDIAMRGDPNDWSVREELKWVWQTNSSCPWQSINRDNFCRKIGANGNVMVVGDSINHEIQWSLMNALITNGSGYGRLSLLSTSNFAPYEMCTDIFGHGAGFNVSFICNVHLTTITSADNDTSNQQPWIYHLDEFNVKLLVLNTGAHFMEDELHTKVLREAFTILTERYPHIHVIYRNTELGHSDCMTQTKPLLAPQKESKDEKFSFYHWTEFNRQNLLAKEIVEEFGYTYMDVYTMLSLRPEAHISETDCLHYCLPGPLDIAVEYLYNILLLL